MSFKKFAEINFPKVDPIRKQIPWGNGVFFKIKIGTLGYVSGIHKVSVSDSTRVISSRNGITYYKSDCIVVADKKGNR